MPLKISVVMPTKNADAYLERAIRSFSSQSWPSRELVIVDGRSEDRTIELAHALLGPDDTLHIQADQNATEAVVRGVGMSGGDVVGLLMADDWLEPDALAAVANAFEANPGVDLVCGGARMWGASAEGNELEETISAASGDVFALDRLLGVPYMAAYFFRRRVWDEMAGFCRDYRYGADRDFLVRCRLAQFRAKGISAFVYNYFRHEGSATLTDHEDIVRVFLHDHRVMSARWLKSGLLSSGDREVVARWRCGETAALVDRQVSAGDYGRVVLTMMADAVQQPRGAVAVGRQLLGHLRRKARSLLVASGS